VRERERGECHGLLFCFWGFFGSPHTALLSCFSSTALSSTASAALLHYSPPLLTSTALLHCSPPRLSSSSTVLSTAVVVQLQLSYSYHFSFIQSVCVWRACHHLHDSSPLPPTQVHRHWMHSECLVLTHPFLHDDDDADDLHPS
jgi:hypothetical protein